jgi:hypothetical protein
MEYEITMATGETMFSDCPQESHCKFPLTSQMVGVLWEIIQMLARNNRPVGLRCGGLLMIKVVTVHEI